MSARLFLDCEFTSTHLRADLISLALVSFDDLEFYAETTYRDWKCNAFVRKVVLPLLEHTPEVTVPAAELPKRLHEWLGQFAGEVLVHFDAEQDGRLLVVACGGKLPPNVRCENVRARIDYGLVEAYFASDPSRRRHHALHDARALREAYR